MSQELARLFIAVLAAALVARMAMRADGGTRRRQAFTLGAVGFGLLALANVLALASAAPALLAGAIVVGLAVLLSSLVGLFLAYREGELSNRLRRAGPPVTGEREKVAKRERRAREEREKTS